MNSQESQRPSEPTEPFGPTVFEPPPQLPPEPQASPSAEPAASGPEPGAATAPLVHETHVDSKDAPKAVEPPPPLLEEPLLFERYKPIGPPLGGGMGNVYKVRDSVLGNVIALKTMRQALLARPPEVQRFKQEARAIAQLSHENIITIHHFEVYRGEPYFTMEYLEGGSLSSRLAEFHKKEPAAIAAFMEKVARAVGFAHSKNIIHRDLKPGNILLDKDGEPKVSDFGLAKFLNEDLDITRPEQRLGTWYYMSPEQAMGEHDHLSPASDVWSLGVIFYELLTGQKPFNGDTRETISKEICKKEPLAPGYYRKGLDTHLESIIGKCVTKDSTSRYRDACELANDLQRWQRGQAVAPPPRPPGFRRKTAFLALILLFVVLLWAPHHGPRESEKSEIDPLLQIAAQLQKKLEDSEKLVLIAKNGKPLYSRKLYSTPGIQVVPLDKEGYYINADSFYLEELFPAPAVGKYRFSAEIKHEVSQPNGTVGLFAGVNNPNLPAMSVYLYLALGMSDAVSEKLNPRFFFRKTFLSAMVHVAAQNDPENEAGELLELFTPAPRKTKATERRDWKNFSFEVREDLVQAYIDKVAVPPYTFDYLNKKSFESIEALRNLKPDSVIFQGMVPDLSGRRPIGLFVDKGSAYFRNVTLERLED